MPVFHQGPRHVIFHGDCLKVLRALDNDSVDSIVTDPPYGLEFMGREWDSFKPSSARLRTRVDGRTNPAEGKSITTTPEAYVAGQPFQLWCQQWATECLRVLKPGGHLVSFGGSRTWHRLASAVEDAGFEIRDSIAWLYGSGFPKSLDVSKAIDKARTEDHAPVDAVRAWLNERRLEAGLSHDAVNKHFGHASNGGGSSSAWTTNPSRRELPTWEQWIALKSLFGFGDDMDGEVRRLNGRKGTPGEAWETAEVLATDTRYNEPSGVVSIGQGDRTPVDRQIKAANSEASQQWQGWGTALKPAFEPIVVGRKPIKGTVAANVLEHGTGALNIDACRVEGVPDAPGTTPATVNGNGVTHGAMTRIAYNVPTGRWPTNVVLDESQAAELDKQSGTSKGGRGGVRLRPASTDLGVMNDDGWTPKEVLQPSYGDSGGASRFFPVFKYQAKAPAKERPKDADGKGHPTVKPLEFMRWLVKLVTPPGGTVLEPFAGSGTTVEAALLEGFKCFAIEREPDYLPMIVQRIERSCPDCEDVA